MYLEKTSLAGRDAVAAVGARGIGAASVDGLLEAGAPVILADYGRETLEEASDRLAAIVGRTG